jgi:hypothetical protein
VTWLWHVSISVEFFSPDISRFRPSLFYWVFLSCDAFSLAVQTAGGILATISAGTSGTGVNLSLAGLAFQVATMAIFCGLFLDYMVRYFRLRGGAGIKRLRVRLFFGFMSSAILLVMGRCIYRLIELRGGYSGTLFRDEPLFIALEGVWVFPRPPIDMAWIVAVGTGLPKLTHRH